MARDLTTDSQDPKYRHQVLALPELELGRKYGFVWSSTSGLGQGPSMYWQ